ncbi:hypothetical protein NP233_g5677 [Leucocoprinus birnbaumii]|uniref:Uncharacterized protein n=1 Tax=Leucocoprinus birnbaumii TaxID=56174 RepID=A0AAD5VSS0_9AGAR|nr:hypothetical protein NP233_g5677 [Leucocoprinus birnbaumii]
MPSVSPFPSPSRGQQERQRIPPPPDPIQRFILALKGQNVTTATIDNSGKKTRRKKQVDYSSTILEKLFDAVRWLTRSKQAFVDYSTVWMVGINEFCKDRENMSSYVDDSEDFKHVSFNLQQLLHAHSIDSSIGDEWKSELMACFEALAKSTKRFEQVILALISQPPEDDIIGNLASQMSSLRSATCSNDQTAIKSRLHDIARLVVPGGELRPSFGSTVGKHEVGFSHPQIARLLIPLKYLALLESDYEGTIANISAGALPVTDDLFPAHLYPLGTKYNPKNISKGLFRGHAWILAYKIIFTAPSSAKTISYKEVAHKSKARTNKLRHVTPKTIAYACLHVTFAMSSTSTWKCDMSPFSKEQFYTNLVEVLTPDTKWRRSLFRMANELIFGRAEGLEIQPELATTEGPSDIQLMAQQNEANDNSDDDNDNEDEDEDEELRRLTPGLLLHPFLPLNS